MAKQKDIVFKHNKWGILEVYENGDYAGVIATWPNPDEELGIALLKEIARVQELSSAGIKPEPKDWSEFYENKSDKRVHR